MLTPTTKEDAITMMLSCIGIAPKPLDLTASPLNSEVALAKHILEDVLRDIQTQGWAFNREDNFPLTRNAKGKIELPQNALRVESLRDRPHLIERSVEEKGQTKTYLYDTRKHSFLMEITVYMTVVWLFDFAEIPEVYRRYVIIRASRIFQDRAIGSSTLHAFNERDELAALAALKNADNELNNPNFIAGNAYFADLLDR